MGIEAAKLRGVAAASTRGERDRPPTRRGASSERRWWIGANVLLVVSIFVLRSRYFGNPFVDGDEQFYLLVGDRMLHGAVPYVDVWDRKPVGLFLLYAAIRELGGDGIVQYQFVATAFCAATAMAIAAMARPISSPAAAMISAFAYAPALAMSGGEGGQSPVFYNLLIASAALLVVRLLGRPPSLAAVRRTAPAAMILAGIAVQIKYTALFEGAFLASALGWIAWQVQPRRARLADMVVWLVLLAAPTMLAALWYAAHGFGRSFVFANFTSILQRGTYGRAGGDLAMIGIRLLPFLLCIALGEWLLVPFKRPREPGTYRERQHRFVIVWLAVAAIAFLGFGTYFNHYALPLLVPLAVAAAPTFTVAFRGAGPVLATVLLAAVYLPYPFDADRIERVNGNVVVADRLTSLIRGRLAGGCLFVFYGQPILYHTTGSCLPTRWAFPYHLSLRRETPALGIDAVGEINRIMAKGPSVVVDSDIDDDEIDPLTQAALRRWLRARYVLIDRVRLAHSTVMVWQRRR